MFWYFGFCECGTDHLRVHLDQFFHGRVRDCTDTQIRCQSCRKGMTSQGGRRCHRRHNLNVLKLDEFEVVVVEAIVHYHLLNITISEVSYLSGDGRLISFM